MKEFFKDAFGAMWMTFTEYIFGIAVLLVFIITYLSAAGTLQVTNWVAAAISIMASCFFILGALFIHHIIGKWWGS